MTGAHTSELVDPTPWLEGGELLMTTGLQLAEAPEMAAYVERVTAAGVACLALGTGRRLTHEAVPDALASAARSAGLPLVEVPQRTPFIALTKAVHEQLAAARYEEQLQALEGQRLLTAAAVDPGGTTAVAAVLAGLLDAEVLVTDAAGRVLAASPDRARSLAEEAAPELERLRPHGLAAAASVTSPGRVLRVQPLGAQRLRGFLVCVSAGRSGTYERSLAASAASLLTLDLERSAEHGADEQRRRAEVVHALARGAGDEAGQLLAGVGVDDRRVRAVVVRPRGGTLPEVLLERLGEHGLLAADVAGLPGDVLLLVPGPDDDVIDRLRAVLTGTAAVGGVGAAVPPAAVPGSVRQARRAADLAGRDGELVDVGEVSSVRLLLALAPAGTATTFADAVLGPVEQAGPRAAVLLDSLRAFLDANGSWDAASAALGVHRHTLRQRLRHVEQLTGRRLDSGPDRMEMLLALVARDVAAGS